MIRGTSRFESIVDWRSRVEDPWLATIFRRDAEHRLADMVPPISQREWNDAGLANDERWSDQSEKGRAVRAKRRRFDHPPPKSYAGFCPLPGDRAYVSGEKPTPEALRRMRAILATLKSDHDARISQSGPGSEF